MPTKTWLVLLAVTGAYVVAGKLGLALAFVHESATPVWPPTGIALAACLLLGRSVWPAILFGAFVVNLTTAGTWWTSILIATGNTLEAVVGALLTERFARGAACFERGRDVFRFATLSGVFATMIAATIGVTSLWAGGLAEASEYGSIWLTWWLGDMAGCLVVTPILVLWARNGIPAWTGRQALELAALLVAVLAAGAFAFHPGLPFAESRYPLAYLAFPLLLWASFRFSPREAATCVLLLSIPAVANTLAGAGPFAVDSPNQSLLLLDAFLVVASLTALGLASVVREQNLTAEALRAAEGHLQSLLRGEQEETRRAWATSKAKDQFLAILGHELRSPLAALSNAAAGLRAMTGSDDRFERLQAIIERQSRYLSRLVNELLDSSRLESGKISLKREPVALPEVVERCVGSFRDSGALGERTVSARLEPVWVDADPTRLEQIVTNLLDNAIKFTSTTGRIRLTVASETETGVLRIEDDGRGIDPKALPNVFDFFTQADDSLDRAHGGLGIGLTIARRLAEMHEGTIEARSEGIGRGSAFVVRLPRTEPPRAPAASPLRDSTEPGGPLRVLVIEDYEDTRTTLQELLEGLGHRVASAGDGPRGLDLARAVTPEVALIDIGLPGLDGYAVARALRSSASGARIRLVALTGYGESDVRRKALESGFDEVLVKPVDPSVLVRALGSPPVSARRPTVAVD